MSLTIYTDGACSGNPGCGGYAAVIVRDGEEEILSGSESETTNNRMELRAAIEGLNALGSMQDVEIVTDSEYVLRGFTEWLPGWVARGWRTSAKKPVKNDDLWRELLAAVKRHSSVRWTWTRGHAGHHFNEIADEHAQRQAGTFVR